MRFIEEMTRTAQRWPEKVALITERSQLSFNELLKMVTVLDRGLAERGVKPGDLVVLDTKRGELNIAFLLLLSYRGLRVAFCSHALCTAAGLAPDFWVSDSDQGPDGPGKITIDGSWFRDLPTAPLPDLAQMSETQGGILASTSGSTGTPKIIACDEATKRREIATWQPFRDENVPTRRWISAFEPTTSWAIRSNLGAVLLGGAVIMLGDERQKILSYIDVYAPDYLITSPLLLQQVIEMAGADQFLSSVRDIQIGGARCPTSLISMIHARTTARLHISYGVSEFGGLCSKTVLPGDIGDETHIGRMYRDDLEIAFFDETLRLLPDATEGIVGIRPKEDAQSTMHDYTGAAQQSEGTGYHHGYFFPGDIMKREGNELFLIGRSKNIVNVGGNKFSLDELQRILEGVFPGANFVAIAVAPDEGPEAIVLHYTSESAVPEVMAQDTLSRISRNLRLSRLVRHSAFPTTPTGKIDTEALRRNSLN